MLQPFKLHLEELSDRVVPSAAPVHSVESEVVVSVLNPSDMYYDTSGCCSGWSYAEHDGAAVVESALPLGQLSEEDHRVWWEWVAALSASSATVPISHMGDTKERITSLAICETGDIKIDAAYRYSQLWFGKTIELSSGSPDWEAAIAELEKVADGCLQQIVITGHGNPYRAGPFTLDGIKDGNSPQARFLKLLKQKAGEGATIELRVCNACSENNHELLQEVVKLTGCQVIGYADTYAIKPHGQQWIAKPKDDGTVTVEKGEKFTAYQDSWVRRVNIFDILGKRK
jgi:hypothetical protein